MPIHDWTRVGAGTFHAFHLSWISEIQLSLNGLLPPDYYAQAEQIIGPMGPDILTLQLADPPADEPAGGYDAVTDSGGGTAVAVARPRTRPTTQFTADAPADFYTSRRRSIVVRHASGDRIVALLEILSPGNKSGRYPFNTFVGKALDALGRGYHLLLIDLFPPTPRDPAGVHAAVWAELSDVPFAPPAETLLTLVSYAVGPSIRAYIEPTAVGREVAPMPLFLDAEQYVDVPLEATYQAAYRGVARRWKAVLEAAD